MIEAIQELTDERWNGLAAQGCAMQFQYWIMESMSLLDKINEFRDVLKDNAPKIEDLLSSGKKLKI